MGEQVQYWKNDFQRDIERTIRELKEFQSEKIDGRAKAIVITKLEEAALWAMTMFGKVEDDI